MNWIHINVEDSTTWPQLGQKVLLHGLWAKEPMMATFIFPDRNYKFYIHYDEKPLTAHKQWDCNNIVSVDEGYCWASLPCLPEEIKQECLRRINNRVRN